MGPEHFFAAFMIAAMFFVSTVVFAHWVKEEGEPVLCTYVLFPFMGSMIGFILGILLCFWQTWAFIVGIAGLYGVSFLAIKAIEILPKVEITFGKDDDE